MSRRTKLTIAALFLVLSGIVAAYAVKVWTVKEPLRFRLVGVSGPVPSTPPRPDGKVMRYEIEARNVTSVPITLWRILIPGPSDDELWFEYQGRKIRHFGVHDGVVIGGHKTMRFTLCFYGGESDADDFTDVPWEITYDWEVRILGRMNGWLRENAPTPLRWHIQRYDSSYSSAALEIGPEHHRRAIQNGGPKP